MFIEKIKVKVAKYFVILFKRNTADISNLFHFIKVILSSLDFLLIFKGNRVSSISKKNLIKFF